MSNLVASNYTHSHERSFHGQLLVKLSGLSSTTLAPRVHEAVQHRSVPTRAGSTGQRASMSSAPALAPIAFYPTKRMETKLTCHLVRFSPPNFQLFR
nr:hypothetical protein Itr_chr04CG07210 [Ipomoea trifida]